MERLNGYRGFEVVKVSNRYEAWNVRTHAAYTATTLEGIRKQIDDWYGW